MLSLISLLDANYMKELCCSVQRDMEPPSKLHLIKDQGYLHRAVFGRLWFGCSVLRSICKAFLVVPFKRFFYYSEEKKHFVNSGREVMYSVLWLFIPCILQKSAKQWN